MKRAYYIVLYYLSYLVFGGVGLALNIVCAVLLLLPGRVSLGRNVRRVIRALFDLWVKWLNATGVVRVSFHGFDGPIEGRVVVVANHPSLIDAPLLLARMPDATCIFKPALMRNPVLGPAAIMAGYTPGGEGIDTIRTVADKVAAGRSLLVFPEGTRTSEGCRLGAMKSGFALVAARAGASVQLVVVRATPGLLTRGRPWWRPPADLPAFVSLTLDRRWEYAAERQALELTGLVERRLLEVLA